jgi:hypothetical protein
LDSGYFKASGAGETAAIPAGCEKSKHVTKIALRPPALAIDRLIRTISVFPKDCGTANLQSPIRAHGWGFLGRGTARNGPIIAASDLQQGDGGVMTRRGEDVGVLAWLALALALASLVAAVMVVHTLQRHHHTVEQPAQADR